MNLLGDPLFNILGPTAGDATNPESARDHRGAEAEYNLDDPAAGRYVKWLGDFVTGDFGVQFSTTVSRPCRDLIKERLPRTPDAPDHGADDGGAHRDPVGDAGRRPRPNNAVDKISTVMTFLIIALPNFALGGDPEVRLRRSSSTGFPPTFVASDPFWTGVWQLCLPGAHARAARPLRCISGCCAPT